MKQPQEASVLPAPAAAAAALPHWTDDAASVEEMMGLGEPVAAVSLSPADAANAPHLAENMMGQLMQPLGENGCPVQAIHRSASAPALAAQQHIPQPQQPTDRGHSLTTSGDGSSPSRKRAASPSGAREQLTQEEKQTRRYAALAAFCPDYNAKTAGRHTHLAARTRPDVDYAACVSQTRAESAVG